MHAVTNPGWIFDGSDKNRSHTNGEKKCANSK
jgi:hypothetical protein